MIPKTIHYCWFGNNPIPDKYKKYMESWSQFMPDYRIIEWNENNFDIQQNEYCRQAYENKKWAFVSDFARLKIIYEYGGIYLDTDVELIQSLSPLVSNGNGFIGFQNPYEINTGLGFAAQEHSECIRKMLEIYNKSNFIRVDGALDLTPCPVFNTVVLRKLGMKTGKKNCTEIQNVLDIKVLPIDYLNPTDLDDLKVHITSNTYSIHHFTATWYSNEQKRKRRIKKMIPSAILQLRTGIICKRDIKKRERQLYG